jgi:hypothetical protein
MLLTPTKYQAYSAYHFGSLCRSGDNKDARLYGVISYRSRNQSGHLSSQRHHRMQGIQQAQLEAIMLAILITNTTANKLHIIKPKEFGLVLE